MRASIKWLKDYVDFDTEPEILAESLTMAGVPVATLEYLGKNLEKVVTGKIIAIERHPDADKLLVCKIDVGAEVLTIITGAANVQVGHIVPVATIGAKLSSGLEIKESTLRGLPSYGMLCSSAELNIDAKLLSPEARVGIYLLPADTPIGVDVRGILGLDDVVLEFELTANRADCFSMLGLAREIAVVTGGTLKTPVPNVRETGNDRAADLVKISIEDTALCSRFAARVLKNVKIGPSPVWLQHRVQAAGMRAINNVVDVTNFVMLELGQPMHAYDYDQVAQHSIIVRRAKPQEELITLDDNKRELTAEMLVIADEAQAVGVAGVMGGLATEVTASTQTVLLEAAAFNGVSIRRTSRALGLRSEASGRFERGVDTANISRALDRAAQLLEEMGACTVCPEIVDCYPKQAQPTKITFIPEKVNQYIGISISSEEMVDILRKLEFDVSVEAGKITVVSPTWRGDVTGQADICEEIARIYGYNKIPSTTPSSHMARGGQSYLQTIADRIKNSLSGVGFDEVVSFSFTHPLTLEKLNIVGDDKRSTAVEILNPITDDFPLLRTTLLGGVLEVIGRNLARKNEDLKIYELGTVYLPEKMPLETLPVEPLLLCGAMLGKRHDLSWNLPKEMVDFYDAKGTVEVVLASLGIRDYEVTAGQDVSLHPGKTALFMKNQEVLATVGEVHPKVLQAFDLNRKVYIFEMNVECLAKHAVLLSSYQPLPKFPVITRDLALVLPSEITADQVMKIIKTQAGSLLTTVQLFDVYTGEQVPTGARSLAFSLTFQAKDRTLLDSEIEGPYNQIVASLEEQVSATLRR